ncbi:MAG TPA: amidohydrolase family protein [Candidatus Binatia bacterium]|jgi:dihydroorotase
MFYDWLLKNGRLIDPASGTDRIADVAIVDDEIVHIGRVDDASTAREVADLSGCIVSPGLIDTHLHAYGALSCLKPDTLGVLSGVTAMVDAGSCGAYNYPEMQVLLDDACETDWFAFLHLQPLGVTGGTGEHYKFVRSMSGIPLAQMSEWVGPDGRVRGLKIPAFGPIGVEPVQLAKAVARMLGIPLYIHIGDFMVRPQLITTPAVLNLLEQGDMATHVYTGVYGGPYTEGGLAAKELKAARERGVILDVGFGSFNFNFTMARIGFEQGIFPDTISSDLQNRNVTGPAKSLCHVMSLFLAMGMSLSEVLACVTSNAAKAIYAEPWRGRITLGGRADITVLKLEEGDFRFRDCDGQEISGTQRLIPLKVWKAGKKIDCRPEAVEELENWMVEKNEDGPLRVELDSIDREFLRLLEKQVRKIPWKLQNIHETLEQSMADSEIPLRRAIALVQAICLTKPFPMCTATLLRDLGQDRTGKYIESMLSA